MRAEDRAAFAVLLYGLGEVFNESVSDDRAELYFFALEDLARSNGPVRREAAHQGASDTSFSRSRRSCIEAVPGTPRTRRRSRGNTCCAKCGGWATSARRRGPTR